MASVKGGGNQMKRTLQMRTGMKHIRILWNICENVAPSSKAVSLGFAR